MRRAAGTRGARVASYQSLTRGEVRRRIGALAYTRQHFGYGPLTQVQGAGTILLLERANQLPPEHFVGHLGYFGAGTAAGQVRSMISGALPGQLLVSPAYSPLPTVGDTLEIWPGDVDPNAINDHIRSAIGRGSDIVNTYVEAVPTIDSTRMIIDIPTTFTRVSGFHYYYNGIIYAYTRSDWLDPTYDQYQVRGRKLYLSTAVQASATDLVIQGYRVPALPSADADLIEMNPEYVMYMAAAMMEAGDAAQPGYDPEASGQRATVWYREALDLYSRMGTAWLSDTVELPL